MRAVCRISQPDVRQRWVKLLDLGLSIGPYSFATSRPPHDERNPDLRTNTASPSEADIVFRDQVDADSLSSRVPKHQESSSWPTASSCTEEVINEPLPRTCDESPDLDKVASMHEMHGPGRP